MQFNTPVLLNVFNRPEEASRVIAVLKKLLIPTLYIHCDGPRLGNSKDIENVNKVKQLISNEIDWNCDLHLMYEEDNQGCGMGPYRAMNWFFSNVECGIILEDDCLPHADFFMYCQELLELYKDDSRIGLIAGTNNGKARVNNVHESYFFSAWTVTWGWATWKRVWDLYEFDLSLDNKSIVDKVAPFIQSKKAIEAFLRIIQKQEEMDNGVKSYWDYQLTIALLCNNMLTIRPSVNLISNIGFNDNATHTKSYSAKFSDRPTYSILPLKHPKDVCVKSHKKDNQGLVPSFYKRVKRAIKRVLGRLF